MNRGRARRAVVWLGTIAGAALLVREILIRGPLTWTAPETVLSNGVQVQRDTEPYMRFLNQLRRRLPRHATVAILLPDGDLPDYMIAIGQLPDQTVLPQNVLGSGSSLSPEWVACFGRPFEDPRFRLDGSFTGGLLFRRRT